MYNLPFIASEKELFHQITELVKENGDITEEPIILTDARKAIEHLNLEMPELIIINFSDPKIDAYALLDVIMSDTWLLHGGIIAISKDDKELEQIENIRGANIIAVINRSDLAGNLPKVLSIIENNRRILFQREIGYDLVKHLSGSFTLGNDLLEVKCYVNLICNFLYNSNRLGVNKKFNLRIALNEMLINAIEHGNCNITYDDKSEWLEEHGTIDDLIRARCEDPEIAKRRVTFEYTITTTSSQFLIIDEGEGFNWRELKDPTDEANLFELHGRGILMTKNVAQNITYNEKGNEVSFEISHEHCSDVAKPALFRDMKFCDFKKGDIIFKEGEISNYLYYIVSGHYDVIVNNKTVSTLHPDDIFMGEMSFLLNNRRTATVRADADGKLIEVSKREFIRAIKKKPHYALFLSRLLAQRIKRSNQDR